MTSGRFALVVIGPELYGYATSTGSRSRVDRVTVAFVAIFLTSWALGIGLRQGA